MWQLLPSHNHLLQVLSQRQHRPVPLAVALPQTSSRNFCETHLTGQAVFRVAAAELRSASDALSDKARCVPYTNHKPHRGALLDICCRTWKHMQHIA